MHTENAPRPTDNPAVAGKPSASDNSHDSRRLASSLITAFKPFVSARLSKPQDQQTQDQQTRKDATAPNVMPLFMAALLCCAALNSVLAGKKP